MEIETIAGHYDTVYFNKYQKEIGEFGGKANRFLFEKHIAPSDTVLDFGCGGGFLLNNLECDDKIGVELNPVAREHCSQEFGIKCYETLDEVPDESLDVVVSSHCLEHTTNPFDLVASMYQKLRINGRIVIVVPLDSYQYRWTDHDVNNHLYSFSPMNLGNILQGVGFSEIETMTVLHKWPPRFRQINKIFGQKVFHLSGWIYGLLNKRYVQVKGVGVKRS